MNREILFRGKRSDNGEWVYGKIVSTYSGRAFNLEGSFFFGEQHEGDFKLGEIYGTEVIPETCGQYTGLTDKNGRKIFEGDIIEYEEKYGIARYSVVWNKKTSCFSAAGYNGMIIGDFAFYASNKCKVIGNVHDNPELLKEDNNA